MNYFKKIRYFLSHIILLDNSRCIFHNYKYVPSLTAIFFVLFFFFFQNNKEVQFLSFSDHANNSPLDVCYTSLFDSFVQEVFFIPSLQS